MNVSNDTQAFVPVILCGGSGTRLRPLTRDDRPKQFLALNGPYSLLQQTLRRILNTGDAPACDIMTITLDQYRQETAKHVGYIDKAALTHLICEPLGRNTAAAIALAALKASTLFGMKSILWIVPSDHHITDEAALRKACLSARALATRGKIVTFGIPPTRPETGYGYIRLGFGIGSDGFEISSFNEKPDEAKAQHYLSAGDYLWNSGMFMFSIESVLNEYTLHAPDLLEAVQKAMNEPALYDQIPAIAFDRAVLEKTTQGAVVPCDPGWSDLGSWESLQRVTGETQEALLRRHQG